MNLMREMFLQNHQTLDDRLYELLVNCRGNENML